MAIKKTLIFGDAHLEQQRTTNDSYLLFKRVAKVMKPDNIICLGDLMDFQYISRFADAHDLEGKRIAFDMKILKEELEYFKSCLKKGGKLTYLEGNHEERLQKLLNAQPVLQGLISLEETADALGIDYIATEEQPYLLMDGLRVCHGLSYAENFSNNLLKKLGGESLIQGHTHRTQSTSMSFYNDNIASVIGVGSLCEMNEDYVKGRRVTGHTNSFAILYVDEETGTWDVQTILIKDGKCIVEGKLYSLS